MKLTAFLPPHFKDLIQFVPTILFEVTDWSSLLSESAVLSKRLITGQGKNELVEQLSPPFQNSVRFKNGSLVYRELSDEMKEKLAEKILTFYFQQVLYPGPKFLDLSIEHFFLEEEFLGFHPTSLWSDFSQDFHHGIGTIYKGFYLNNDELFTEGLKKTQLIDNAWPLPDQMKMKQLFHQHFGQALEDKMLFKIEHFQDSFHQVFKFLLSKKVKINSDFLKLGIMLVTLYTSLETLQVPLDAKRCFLKALGDNHR